MSDEVVHTPLTVFMEGLVPGADPAHWDELTQFGRFSSETFESTKKSCVAYEFVSRIASINRKDLNLLIV